MNIERKIVLNNNVYYIGVELKYNNKVLRKKDGTYFDLGDYSILIKHVMDNYPGVGIYDKDISYMNDVIYLLDAFPFLSYVKNVSLDENNTIRETCTIYKEEILKYMSSNGIKGGLFDRKNTPCPLIYN